MKNAQNPGGSAVRLEDFAKAAEKDQGVDIFIDTILAVRLFSFH